MRRDASGGFTLIEALVAFAIVAAATVVVQRSLVQSRLGTGRTSALSGPEWIARSLMAEPLSDNDLREGGRTGLAEGHRYAIRLTPLAEPEPDGAAGAAPERPPAGRGTPVHWVPVRVSISVETDRRGWLTFETVKLGRVVSAGPVARVE